MRCKMGRLTERHGNTYVPNENANYEPMNCMDKLGRLEDLEEQGRLIELPCAVGDTVWDIIRDEARGYGAIREKIVDGIEYRTDGFYMYANEDEWLGKLGELVFLTKEEAERKLEELKGENNEL